MCSECELGVLPLVISVVCLNSVAEKISIDWFVYLFVVAD